LVDVRSFPHSQRNPQFNRETFERDLPKVGVRYVWIRRLGGRRNGLGASSRNTCWKNRSFRNYADYMETDEFQEGLEELMQVAANQVVAVMCAEAVYWRCHRSMIADALISKGIEVTHILDMTHSKAHDYTKCAQIVEGKLTYHH